MAGAVWLSDLLWRKSSENCTTMKVALTMVEINGLQTWLRRDYHLETALVIERQGDRNRVALRFFLPHGTGEVEAGWLRDLRKKGLGRSLTRQRLEQKLREREGERAHTKTVA